MQKMILHRASILKKLALFMLPILGALVLQAAYGAVDLLVVEDSVPPPAFPRFPQEAGTKSRYFCRNSVCYCDHYSHRPLSG